MAGAGYLLFVAGQKLTAAQVNTYLMQQSIPQFASNSARDTALSAVLDEGLLSTQADTNCITQHTGTAWSTIGPTYGVWTTYSPVWTANGGSAPSIGNGTLEGAYQRIGRTVRFRLRMFAGSTTTFGSGSSRWRFTVPFAGSAAIWSQSVDVIYLSVSSSAEARADDLSKASCIPGNTSYAEVSLSAGTQVWATGYYVIVSGAYECGADA